TAFGSKPGPGRNCSRSVWYTYICCCAGALNGTSHSRIIGSTGERRASRRRDHRRQLFCIELSSVLFLDSGSCGRSACRVGPPAGSRNPAGSLSPHPLLPEAMPFLLLQGLYG